MGGEVNFIPNNHLASQTAAFSVKEYIKNNKQNRVENCGKLLLKNL